MKALARPAQPPPAQPRASVHHLSLDGRRRTHRVVLPADPTGAPVVLALHGSNQTGRTLRRATRPGLDTLTTRLGAVVVYPDGWHRHWNDARSAIRFRTRREGVDDVAHLRAVVEDVAARTGADATRVVAVGFSNGGQMVDRLAHESPQPLLAAMMISATHAVADQFQPAVDHHRPTPVLLVHGTADRTVPYDGGTAALFRVLPRGQGLSAPQTARYWAARNGVHAPATTTRRTGLLDPGSGQVEVSDHVEPGRAPVRLVTLVGAVTQVPGLVAGPRLMGPTSRATSAVDELVDFLDLVRVQTGQR